MRLLDVQNPDDFLPFASASVESGGGDPRKLLRNDGLIARYVSICEERFHASDDYANMDPLAIDTAENWESERNTWKLVASLFRIRTDSSDNLDTEAFDSTYLTDKSLVDRIFTTDKEAMELQAVREWLEEVATYFDPVEVREGYRQHTANNVRLVNSGRPVVGDRDYATELDPDGPTRQNKSLAFDDEEYERNLHRTIFEYIRRGNMGDAFELLERSHHMWYTACLLGNNFYSNKNIDKHADSTQVTCGNINRKLWKKICGIISNEEQLTPFEKATYAYFSGDIKNTTHVLRVAETWEDCLHAYVNALIETKLEEYFKRNAANIPTFGLAESTECLSAKMDEMDVEEETAEIVTIREVLDMLFNHPDERIRTDSRNYFHVAQASIIGNQIDKFIVQMAQNVSHGNTTPQCQRFAVHFVLFLRNIGYEFTDEATAAADKVIMMFVEFLNDNKMFDLISLYVSHLPYDLQVDSYSRVLSRLPNDFKSRHQYLQLARDYGLPVPEIISRTVELTIQLSPIQPIVEVHNVALDMSRRLNEDQQVLMRAIEWLEFDLDNCFDDALRKCNQIIRLFLMNGTLFPVHNILNTTAILGRLQQMSSEIQKSHHRLFVHQVEIAQYNNLVQALILIDEFTQGWIGERHVKEKGREVSLWESGWKDKTEETIKSILLLLDDKWLNYEMLKDDSNSEDEIEQQRAWELKTIRGIYIPHLVLRLLDIYYETRDVSKGNLQKALSLSVVVASEENHIYQEFMKTEGITKGYNNLERFLTQIRRCSLAILDRNSRNPLLES